MRCSRHQIQSKISEYHSAQGLMKNLITWNLSWATAQTPFDRWQNYASITLLLRFGERHFWDDGIKSNGTSFCCSHLLARAWLVSGKEVPTSRCGQLDPTSTSTREVTMVHEGSFSRQDRSEKVAGSFRMSSINKIVVGSSMNSSWELRKALREMWSNFSKSESTMGAHISIDWIERSGRRKRLGRR
jgi:hypothetical protein